MKKMRQARWSAVDPKKGNNKEAIV